MTSTSARLRGSLSVGCLVPCGLIRAETMPPLKSGEDERKSPPERDAASRVGPVSKASGNTRRRHAVVGPTLRRKGALRAGSSPSSESRLAASSQWRVAVVRDRRKRTRTSGEEPDDGRDDERCARKLVALLQLLAAFQAVLGDPRDRDAGAGLVWLDVTTRKRYARRDERAGTPGPAAGPGASHRLRSLGRAAGCSTLARTRSTSPAYDDLAMIALNWLR